jgi:glycosyltransferase involved in cell wall biosynthesis
VRLVTPMKMITDPAHLPLVSVVLVTYKRIELLRETINSFLATTTYPRSRLELILCDDGSSRAIQKRMRSLPCDAFLMADRNQGMGSNTNKGLHAAKGDFVLQLQDDWRCVGPPDFVEAALEVFAERPDVYMIRLREHAPRTFESYRTRDGKVARVYPTRRALVEAGITLARVSDEGSEDLYTDTPHIKRKEFHQILGFYREKMSMPQTESEFSRRFEAQTALQIASIEGYEVFIHTGESQSLNPVQRKIAWAKRLNSNPMTRAAFRFYRTLKHSTIWGTRSDQS